MKNYSLFGVLGASFAAVVAFGACTVTSTTNNTGDDGGTSSSSGGGSDDSATDSPSADGASSSSSSGGSSSGSSSGVADSGEAGTCSAVTVFDPMTCDDCMKANCCDPLVACETADDAGLDDAGNSACMALFTCALGYAATSDAGLDDAVTTCNGGAGATGASTTLTTLLTCATTSCSAQCQ
jgi:hypothetical protein